MTGSTIRSPLARYIGTPLLALLVAFALSGCGTPDALNPATNNGSRVFNLFVISMVVSTFVFLLVVGLLADLLAVNRTLLESLEWRLRKLEERLPIQSDSWRE
jgi:hypothetical protein